jgi:ferritin|tara:strand:- start:315 stop:503 length:189 start_codon:yes stop_codon:yes gene_type:complete
MLHTIKKEGYMKKDKEVKFRTVAVPNEVYKMIKQIAEKQERTIARQVGVLIKKAHAEMKETI